MKAQPRLLLIFHAGPGETTLGPFRSLDGTTTTLYGDGVPVAVTHGNRVRLVGQSGEFTSYTVALAPLTRAKRSLTLRGTTP